MSEINIEQTTPLINIDTATRNYHLPIASSTVLGGIKVGDNLTIEDDGTLNAEQTEYELPVASASQLGGIKVGAGLEINNSILKVDPDTTLSSSSQNAIANSAVNNAISSLTSTVQTNTSSIGTINSSLSTLSNTVSGHTTSIGNLQSTVSTQGDAIELNTTAIGNNTSSITDLSDSVTALGSRVTTAEDDIDAIEGNITTLSGTVDTLNTLTETETTYSYLLPVSTWTAGKLTYEKRGKTGFVFVDIQGSLHLSGGGTTVLYTYSGIELYTNVFGILMSDDGPVLATIDASTGELSLSNLTNNAQTITNLQGSIPLVF